MTIVIQSLRGIIIYRFCAIKMKIDLITIINNIFIAITHCSSSSILTPMTLIPRETLHFHSMITSWITVCSIFNCKSINLALVFLISSWVIFFLSQTTIHFTNSFFAHLNFNFIKKFSILYNNKIWKSKNWLFPSFYWKPFISVN